MWLQKDCAHLAGCVAVLHQCMRWHFLQVGNAASRALQALDPRDEIRDYVIEPLLDLAEGIQAVANIANELKMNGYVDWDLNKVDFPACQLH